MQFLETVDLKHYRDVQEAGKVEHGKETPIVTMAQRWIERLISFKLDTPKELGLAVSGATSHTADTCGAQPGNITSKP